MTSLLECKSAVSYKWSFRVYSVNLTTFWVLIQDGGRPTPTGSERRRCKVKSPSNCQANNILMMFQRSFYQRLALLRMNRSGNRRYAASPLVGSNNNGQANPRFRLAFSRKILYISHHLQGTKAFPSSKNRLEAGIAAGWRRIAEVVSALNKPIFLWYWHSVDNPSSISY